MTSEHGLIITNNRCIIKINRDFVMVYFPKLQEKIFKDSVNYYICARRELSGTTSVIPPIIAHITMDHVKLQAVSKDVRILGRTSFSCILNIFTNRE